VVLSNQYPEVPRRQIAGLRDVLIHDDMGVDLEAVWPLTQKDLPQLEMKLREILKIHEWKGRTRTTPMTPDSSLVSRHLSLFLAMSFQLSALPTQPTRSFLRSCLMSGRKRLFAGALKTEKLDNSVPLF
jgi:hypothetical protein